ncbi:MAG: hypothetical protein SF187_20565 [Deltaproteobacteria bacterium]|nr:hypothetical protein [Deltaproteobacteria bacterium]
MSALLVCSQCMPEHLRAEVDKLESELATVYPADGIDAAEAERIAQAYMNEYVAGCGAPNPPVLQGKTWMFELRLGYAGQPSNKRVGVDAETGAVQGAGGPLFKTFQEFKENVVSDYVKRRKHL